MNMPDDKKTDVVGMFDSIAPLYDKINRRLSFRTDIRWRRKLRKAVASFPNQFIIDVSAGTGDLTIELSRLKPIKLIAADPSSKMLEIASQKFIKQNIAASTVQCYAESLPFESQSFDLATCSFGVRNFESLDQGLSELKRVLIPGGHLAILEFGMPTSWFWSKAYRVYFNHILPLRGKRLSKHAHAYHYLNQTVNQFPFGQEMENRLLEAGFRITNTRPLSGGIAWLYVVRKEN